MNMNEILTATGITKYRLSKISGVPYATISDICSGKSSIEKCSGETLYRISKALNITMEQLLEMSIKEKSKKEDRATFEIFKSNICHRVKEMGDLAFIASIVESDKIHLLFEKKWYPESFYLLAMLDYLCRENNIPLYPDYDELRSAKLREPIYPLSILALSMALNDENIKVQSLEEAIPEFGRFNIVENEVRNVI